MNYPTKLQDKLFPLCILLLCFFFKPANAQQVTPADYQRAQSFLWENMINKKIFNTSITSGFFPDSTGLWYLDYEVNKKEFHRVSFASFEKQPLFDHQRLADSLSLLLEDPVQANELPFSRIRYIRADSLELPIQGDNYMLDLNTYHIALKKEKKKQDEKSSTSPDGKWTAYTENYNLYLKSTESGEIYPLSTDGAENYEYGTYYGWSDLIEGENGKRPEHFSVSWSPDSKWLRANICDLRRAEKMYLLDYSVDTLFRPNLYSYYRGSPGDTTIVQMTPVFYDLKSKKEIPSRLERRGSVANYDIRWIKNSSEVLIIDRERGFKKLDFIKLNLTTGKQEILFSETSETNIPEALGISVFEAFNKFIFLSERSGRQQLYTYDFREKKIQALTPGAYIVHRTIHTDEDKGWIYFTASGKEAGSNPYHQYLYRVSINGGEVESLTPETGNHQVSFSPDGQYFVDEHSTHNTPAKFTLRDARSGQVRSHLAETDISALEALGWSPPEAFEAIARDGETTIYGALWKPTNFDPEKKYPIIDHSYTGPHTQVFPRRFEQIFYSGLQDLAELGFLVVKIDGMGTYGRSKAFHDVSYKNMGQNLLDHVLAIRQLGERYSWADTSRVGIFGHSAGGYDAGHAVLEYPDFYKVAVASSADHDFRMEKAWWPEKYMGWPVDSTYHQVSNITMAGNLKGKLLITHGGMDENVNPSATFKLAEALIKADKEFDMLILPSQRHGYRGAHRAYFRKKRWNYFVEHLLGAEPIWEIEEGN